MKLIPANKFLLLPSFSIYTYLILKQLLFFSNNLNFKINNIILISFVYLYESFIAIIFKKTILHNWKLKDYIQHHFIFSLFMIIYYKYGESLDIHYNNMQNYVVLLNINEIISILQNFNISKKYIFIFKIYSFYILINLIYYEISESITYYNDIKSYKKYFALMPILASLYHIFIILPYNIKFFKKNIIKFIYKL